jgi:hypothetical protein
MQIKNLFRAAGSKLGSGSGHAVTNKYTIAEKKNPKDWEEVDYIEGKRYRMLIV